MAFRERIEAVLQVKDAARFKAGMETAAKSVRGFGRDNKEAAAQTELLKRIMNKLDKQADETAAAMTLVAHAVNDLGDELEKTALKAALANRVMRKSGSSAAFMGKSWGFWKDRLSLTQGEIRSTAITIGAYLSPALIALGSSFVSAALGGGGVAAGGMSSFVFGLAALSTVAKPVVAGIQKIDAAQQSYNVAVSQYGVASLQAATASGHLFAIIKQNGGFQAERAARSLTSFTKAWRAMTAPARGSLLGVLSSGLGAGRALMPAVAGQTNSMAASLRVALGGAFADLSGPGGGVGVINSLGRTFSGSIGPALRGVTNLLVIMGRVIKSAGPWVIKWANAWAETTLAWRDQATQARVTKFLDDAVKNFIAWFGLAKQLGRTLLIIWSSSKNDGQRTVDVLTGVVSQFNDWLQKMKDTGAIDRFFTFWNKSISEAIWALQNPIAAINKWVPKVMDAVARAFVNNAGHVAGVFLQAFWNAGAWAKFLTVAVLMKRFGVFAALGSRLATPFLAAFVAALAPKLALGGAITAAGTAAGEALLAALVAAAPIVIPVVLFVTAAGALAWVLNKIGFGQKNLNVHQALSRQAQLSPESGGVRSQFVRSLVPQLSPQALALSHHRHMAMGGVIPTGGSAIVGEAGLELATAGPRGTRITPLSGSTPDLSGAMVIHNYVAVQVDKREVARAVYDTQAYDKARRGGQAMKGP